MTSPMVANLTHLIDTGPYWLEPALFFVAYLWIVGAMFAIARWQDRRATEATPVVDEARRDAALTPIMPVRPFTAKAAKGSCCGFSTHAPATVVSIEARR